MVAWKVRKIKSNERSEEGADDFCLQKWLTWAIVGWTARERSSWSMKTGNANLEQVQKQGEVSALCKPANTRGNAQEEDRCGVVICVAELAEEAGLAIPDFRAYKTSRLRGVPRGVSRNGIARSKGIETADSTGSLRATFATSRNGIARSKGIET